jgi:uncharacterized Zn finger protein
MGAESPKCPKCAHEEMIPILRTAYDLDYSVRCTKCNHISPLKEVLPKGNEILLEISSIFD